MGLNLIRYGESDFFAKIRTDEEIKKGFSSSKYKIGKEFLDFVNQFDYLWLDEKYSFQYQITPMEQDTFELEAYSNSTSKHLALFKNYTQTKLIDLCFRPANNHNLIESVLGDTGSGKSRFSMASAWITNRFINEVLGKETTLTANNFCFSRSEVVDLVPKIKDFESCIMDEDNESVLGVGSFAEHSQVARFEKTLRSKSKNFWNNSPSLSRHNEHYILLSLGYNDVFKTNKCVYRKRDGSYLAYCLMPSDNSNAYKKLIKDYEDKKRQFQKDLENNLGDEKRLQRLLEMATNLIIKYELTYKNKLSFLTYINSTYRLDIESSKELKRIMESLLDSRNKLFQNYKEKIKEFII